MVGRKLPILQGFGQSTSVAQELEFHPILTEFFAVIFSQVGR